ncbi:MAG: IS3 family transposase [Pseudomonadota bacterium]
MIARLAFIAAHVANHPIRLLCRVLGISRSWFHAWRRTAPERAVRAARHQALIEQVKSIFETSKQRYGAPRIHAELRDQGHRVSRKLVAKLMTSRRDGREASNGIRPPRRKRRMPMTTDSRHGYGIAPNLLDRNFQIAAPDTVWLADISYIPTDEGWLYLAAVKDLGTMEIVGPLSAIASDRLPGNGSMSERLKSTLCEEALKMAIRNRRPPKGLVHHSDRGVQYACGEYQKLLDLHGMTASMSRKGNCLDNAPMESFFGALKTEMVHRTRFRTRREARAALLEYIEIFYNRQRRHSSIGYRTPAQARMDMTIKLAA